ncbi:50S ribosomal protein L11 [Candidatus Woesearchaeota archaeon]|jgi:large subunit ribosomal protein L11|nr:50S ribosomal protein L11 [Candidatus Woesearchaeota archaeon]|tara:strand:+ start:1147 stop:1935 length:789 start_codon:yes stop_codon:yes gene_type:complete
MVTQSVESLVPGGKATAAPPLGPQLGPLGVNIGEVVSEINKKTSAFNGMQVPVKVSVDTDTKEFQITIGTPPASALILKEAGIEKGSGNPLTDKVADVLIEQIIKVAKMKEDGLLGKDLKAKVKEIIGTCNSMGILVEGKPAVETIKEVNEGKYDKEIKEEKTELSAEEMKKLEEEKKKLAEEMEERRAEFEKVGKEILASMEGKERSAIKAKLTEAGIPGVIIKELLPVEGAAPAEGEAKEGEKPAEAKEEPKKEAKEEKK